MLPTCPLESVNTIKKANNFHLLLKKLFAVSEYDFHIFFSLKIYKNKWSRFIKKFTYGNQIPKSSKKYYHPT